MRQHMDNMIHGKSFLRFKPGYLQAFETGRLHELVVALEEHMTSCGLCPRQCRVNRRAGELGFCGVSTQPKVAAFSIHKWEEPPISGTHGSGTIFFSGCSLECRFCQNYPISQLGVGNYITIQELAEEMLKLQQEGAHNINLITPTHQLSAILKGLLAAIPLGLRIPVVYNTSGYERIDILRLLEGIVDIYLPDIKYADPAKALFCSNRADYVLHNRGALIEMWRQVGPLKLDPDGIAYSGMIIRHLVLPDDLSNTRECLDFIASHMGPDVWVSLMNQYFPAHKAVHQPPLNRKVTDDEYEQAFHFMTVLGLHNGFVQEQCNV